MRFLHIEEPTLLLPALFFLVLGFATFVANAAFHRELQRVLPNLRQGLSTTFFYLEYLYLRNRSEVRSRQLDRLLILNVVTPLMFFCSAIYFYRSMAALD